MSSKENPDVPAGYLLEEITSGENGVVTLWMGPDGKDHVEVAEIDIDGRTAGPDAEDMARKTPP